MPSYLVETYLRSLTFALLAVASVLAPAACTSSSGEPPERTTRAEATPTINQTISTTLPSATVHEFVSDRYGFRITLPAGWTATDAVVDWTGAQLEGLASPGWARFTDPVTNRTLIVAAARVAQGTKLGAWQAAMVRAAPAACSDSSSAQESTLGGEPALAWTADCSDGDAEKLAAVHGGLGYMMLFSSVTASDDAEDRRRVFESIRPSFRFTR